MKRVLLAGLLGGLAVFVWSFISHRALIVGVLGVFTWLNISISYWNWYQFPTSFILAEGLDQFLGWLIAGLVMAKIIPGPQYA